MSDTHLFQDKIQSFHSELGQHHDRQCILDTTEATMSLVCSHVHGTLTVTFLLQQNKYERRRTQKNTTTQSLVLHWMLIGTNLFGVFTVFVTAESE